MHHGFYGGPGLGGHFSILPILAMVLFWGLVIFGVVYAIRSLAHHNAPAAMLPKRGSKAIEVLEERYARGEIDSAEFAEKRRILKGGDLLQAYDEEISEEQDRP